MLAAAEAARARSDAGRLRVFRTVLKLGCVGHLGSSDDALMLARSSNRTLSRPLTPKQSPKLPAFLRLYCFSEQFPLSSSAALCLKEMMRWAGNVFGFRRRTPVPPPSPSLLCPSDASLSSADGRSQEHRQQGQVHQRRHRLHYHQLQRRSSPPLPSLLSLLNFSADFAVHFLLP